MNEIERLRCEIAELKKMLGERQQLEQPKSLPTLRDNYELIVDCARFAEGLLSEKDVRKKYHFDEAMWVALNDDAFVERIEAEKLRRVRDGSHKREKAQAHIVRGPDVLATIMDDPKANARHRVDSIKALDAIAEPAQTSHNDADRVVVTITLSSDEKLQFGGTIRPTPDKIIDVAPSQIQPVHDPPPIKRGPGRPPGSKNKPKTTNLDDAPPLPGFAT